MAEENINQQPEQSEQMQRVKGLMSKLEELGLDINLLFDMMGGVAENAVKKSEQNLSGLIETKVKVLGENLSNQVKDNYKTLNDQLTPVIGFIDSIQKQANVQSAAVTPSDGGGLPPGPGLGNDGGSGPEKMLSNIAPILKMLGLVPGSSSGDNTAGFDGMISLANKIAEFNRAIQAPQLEALALMRQSVVQDLTALSKTGGTLPWEREDEPRQPARQVASLNQPQDYKEIAIKMSKGMKIVP